MKDVLHLIDVDLGVTGEDFLLVGLAETLNGLATRLEAELRMDDIDQAAGRI